MSVSYLVVPVPFFTALRRQLASHVDPQIIDRAMHTAGREAAELILRDDDRESTTIDPADLEETLFNILMEAGLGRSRLLPDPPDGWRIINEESPEAETGGCHYTTGFVTAVLNHLQKKSQKVTEISCGLGKGDCEYQVKTVLSS